MLKRLLALFLVLAMTVTQAFAENQQAEQQNETQTESKLGLSAKSAVLIEQSSGKVLYEENADEQMPPASITKIMTMLLVMEALEDNKIGLDDKVTASEHACSMGGTQIWLEPGEQMTVDELLKATAVASANDASVALGEHIAGSEQAFVDLMNQRAAQLSMDNTVFKNATGLDADGHLSTARDIAVMSRELLKHKEITKYTTIWMDSLRDGKNELVNTNKMVRFYKGATGLKTGTTDEAGSCLSASAERNGLSLIAVTMGSKTSKERFASATALLDYGFSNYTVVTPQIDKKDLAPVKVLGGAKHYVGVRTDNLDSVVVKKGAEKNIEQNLTIVSDVEAPVVNGQVLGKLRISLDGEELACYDVKAAEAVDKMSLLIALWELWKQLITLK